jgi:hypothetical protein
MDAILNEKAYFLRSASAGIRSVPMESAIRFQRRVFEIQSVQGLFATRFLETRPRGSL